MISLIYKLSACRLLIFADLSLSNMQENDLCSISEYKLTSIQVCDTQQPKKLTGQDDIHIKIPMSGCHAKTNWP